MISARAIPELEIVKLEILGVGRCTGWTL